MKVKAKLNNLNSKFMMVYRQPFTIYSTILYDRQCMLNKSFGKDGNVLNVISPQYVDTFSNINPAFIMLNYYLTHCYKKIIYDSSYEFYILNDNTIAYMVPKTEYYRRGQIDYEKPEGWDKLENACTHNLSDNFSIELYKLYKDCFDYESARRTGECAKVYTELYKKSVKRWVRRERYRLVDVSNDDRQLCKYNISYGDIFKFTYVGTVDEDTDIILYNLKGFIKKFCENNIEYASLSVRPNSEFTVTRSDLLLENNIHPIDIEYIGGYLLSEKEGTNNFVNSSVIKKFMKYTPIGKNRASLAYQRSQYDYRYEDNGLK